MSISIQLLSPLNGQRQVSIASDIQLSISSTQALNLSTFSVRVDNISVIAGGVFQVVSSPLAEDAYSSTRSVVVVNNPGFFLGEDVQLADAYSGPFKNSILSINNNTIKLKTAVQDLSTANDAYISSLSRGYAGSINLTSSTQLSADIIPLKQFSLNKIVLVVVEISDVDGYGSRAFFSFRTTDTLPPQLFNFPPTIEESRLSFRLVDILQNTIQLSQLNVYFDGVYAIQSGVILPHIVGSLEFLDGYSSSDLEVYLRPRQKFLDKQQVDVDIFVGDGYGNITSYTRQTTNRSTPLGVEFARISPAPESVLDPRSHPIEIYLRVNFDLNERFINVSYLVNQVLTQEVVRGQIKTVSDTGIVRVSSTEVLIKLDNIPNIEYNAQVDLVLFLQEVNEDGDSIGSPFFTRSFEYSTVSATLGPIIDQFSPIASDIISPSTHVSFRLLSEVDRDPIDATSLNVSIGNLLAIDEGYFATGFVGEIKQVFNSGGNAVTVDVVPLQPFNIGDTIDVSISASDLAGNLSVASYSFQVSNTNLPIVSMVPLGGVFNKLIRVRINSDQPSQIYYTIDGSVPAVGKISTFVQTSPVLDVPIYADGLTQVKAFAINSSGIKGSVVTQIYDINSFIPHVEILSPTGGSIQDITTTPVHYTISLQRGYLVRVEISVNNGPKTDVHNTLEDSSALITGLRSGVNNIKVLATDNAGNVGVGQVSIFVNPSSIVDFSLKFAPIVCPIFTFRSANRVSTFNDFIDTRTVIIIGYGSRTQVLIPFAVGSGEDGSPVDFIPNNKPDGRHFELDSFPVITSSVNVLLTRKGRVITVPPKDYEIQVSSGQIVLDHPLETGETLVVEYISTTDLNDPTLFFPFETSKIFAKHGQPNTINALSLAAQMAFENGAARVLVVQPLDLFTDPNWLQTFKVLESEEGYWTVLAVRDADFSSYAPLRLAAYGHVTKMSQIKYRRERVIVATRIGDEDNQFEDSRMSLIDVDQHPTVTRVVDGRVQQLNYSFITAAVAGKASGAINVATPLTRKNLSGFEIHSRLKSPRLDLEKLLALGFTPIQPLADGGVVYQGRTSFIGTNPIQQEISIQRVSDFVSLNLRDLLQKRFVGQNITSDLLKSIKLTSNNFFSQNGDIVSSGSVSNITVDSIDPRQVNLTIVYTPLFPLNNISVSLTVSTAL